jgi:hypothetical protein
VLGGSSSKSPASSQARPPTPREVFEARAEARALLWEAGEISLHAAVDELYLAADRNGLAEAIGDDGVQRIMADAFREVGP